MDINKVFHILAHATTKRQHPWHEMVLATADGAVPDLRRVVLRGFDLDKREIVFHTDIRSPKISILRRNPRAAILFYDPIDKLQLRLPVDTRIHHQDEVTERSWQKTRPFSKICYAVEHPPGTPIPEPTADKTAAEWDPADDARAYGNFAVIACQFAMMDILQLQHGGHQRWRAEWHAPEWIVQTIQA